MYLNKKMFMVLSLLIGSVQQISFGVDQEVKNEIAVQSKDCKCKKYNLGKKLTTQFQQVGVDNNNQPITIAYVKIDNKPNMPTLFLSDQYLGIGSWSCQIAALSKHFNIIAIDPLGTGQSSFNEPTALDGIEGFPGYSFGQMAMLYHKFLESLNVKSPLIWVGIDILGSVGMKYASIFSNDQYKIDKLVLINVAPQSPTGDDPCRLVYLTIAQAEQLSDFYASDPCAALCLLLPTSFVDPSCPGSEEIYNQVVNYVATQPASILRRFAVSTYNEDLSSLMAQIQIPVLYLYSIIDKNDILSRQAQGMAFTGFCPTCNENCTSTTYIPPFPNCEFHTLAGGTLSNRSDTTRFNRYLKEFALGCDTKCCLCNIDPKINVVCPTCS